MIGFTGGDNQGILALESRYEEVLSGQEGLILEMTDARGVRLLDEGESRVEPVDGKDLYISLDANIQLYAQQLAGAGLPGKRSGKRFDSGAASR